MCSLEGENEKIIKLAPGSYLVNRSDVNGQYVFRGSTFYFSVEKEKWKKGDFQKSNNMTVVKV